MPTVIDPDNKTQTEKDELKDLYNAPSRKDKDRNTGKQDQDEVDQLNSLYNAPSRGDSGRNTRQPGAKGYVKHHKKKFIGGGLGVGVIGGGIGLIMIVIQPFQIVHISQLLQGFHFAGGSDFMDNRAGQLIRWARTRSSPEKRNLGYFGNKVANRYTKKLTAAGFVPDFEGGRTVKAFVIDPDTDAGKKALAEAKKQGVEVPDPEIDPDTGKRKIRLDVDGSSLRSRKQHRKILRAAVSAVKIRGVPSAMGGFLMKRRAGINLHNFRSLVAEKGKSKLEAIKEWRKERSNSKKNGTLDNNTELKAAETEDSDGNTTEDAETKEYAEEGNEAKGDAKTEGADKTKKKLSNKLKAGGAIGIGVICAVKAIGDQSEEIQHANIILPLVRSGFETISLGAQIMAVFSGAAPAPDLFLEQIGEVTDELTEVVENEETGQKIKRHYLDAKSINANLGNDTEGLPDIPPSAKPSQVGEKPAFFNIIDSLFTHSFGVANAACSTAGQFLLNLSGGFGGFVLGEVTSAVGGFFGFDPAAEFSEFIARKLAGAEVDTEAKGAKKGAQDDYGAAIGSSIIALGNGGKLLNAEQTRALRLDQFQREQIEFAHTSLVERLFDPFNTRSLIAKGIFEQKLPNDSNDVVQLAFSLPSKVIASISNSFKDLGSPYRAYANTGSFDYGVEKFGFSLDEIEDEKYQDPYENAEKVEPRLEELNEKYGACFGTTIDPSTGEIQASDAPRIDQVVEKSECQDSSEIATRYRFYIADKVAAASLSCYEGFDGGDKCSELDINTSSSSSSSVRQPSMTIDVDALGKSSNDVQCAAGTRDLGVVESKYTGEFKSQAEPIEIRLCQIAEIPGKGNDTSGKNDFGGVVVNSLVSEAWLSLAKAAKADGVNLSANSSFRLADSCGGTGDGKACARPGKSPHQLGVAIDFANMSKKGSSSTSCSGRARMPGNAGWEWLKNNAEDYGFKQYSYEAWHWDPMPMENRCGTSQ